MRRWRKLDESLLEAAADLGCPRWKTFWLVTLPLSSPGVLAGVLLCFIPIVGEFVIPDLLGGSQTLMIGQTIWTEFFGNKDWPAASAVAVVLVCLLVTPIVVFQYQAMRGRGARLTMRKVSAFNLVAIVLGVAFLYLPIVILVIYSFNASRLVAVWGGWSTQWYAELSTMHRSSNRPSSAFASASSRRPQRRSWGHWRRWRWCDLAASAAGCISRR